MNGREQGFEDLLLIIKEKEIRLWVDNGILNCEAVEGVITEELQQSIKEYKEELIEMLEKEKKKLNLPYQTEPARVKELKKKKVPKASKPPKEPYNLNYGTSITILLNIFTWLFLLVGISIGGYFVLEDTLEIGLVVIFGTVILFSLFLTIGAISTNLIDIKRMTAKQSEIPDNPKGHAKL